MIDLPGLVPRHAESFVNAALGDTRVVLVNGARQAGKDTLTPIKVAVDLDPTPDRFLLTGSSRVLALRTLPAALAGRMKVIELWPFRKMRSAANQILGE